MYHYVEIAKLIDLRMFNYSRFLLSIKILIESIKVLYTGFPYFLYSCRTTILKKFFVINFSCKFIAEMYDNDCVILKKLYESFELEFK